MSATSALPQIKPQNPFETARLALIQRLLMWKVAKPFGSFATPSDFEAVAADIRDAAIMFDEWLAAIGSEVRDNAVTSVDSRMFAGSFTGAVDGNETGVCEEQAESLRQYAEEGRAERRVSSW